MRFLAGVRDGLKVENDRRRRRRRQRRQQQQQCRTSALLKNVFLTMSALFFARVMTSPIPFVPESVLGPAILQIVRFANFQSISQIIQTLILLSIKAEKP
jgi:hypothetical protein